jgi:hypothetical protein
MIKTFIDGYVIFEWQDGNTCCLTIDIYNKFAEKHNLPKI